MGWCRAARRVRRDRAVSAGWTDRGACRGDFPFGTLTINTTGALLLGLLTGLTVEGDVLVLAGTATLGSYTTFSTWMLESHRLAEDTQVPSAIVNVLLSLAVGVGAAALGRTIGAHA